MSERPLDPSGTDWTRVRRVLGVPYGWKLRPIAHKGYWTLTATGRGRPMDCGHQSMQVTAPTLPMAVALLAARVRFHRDGG